MNINNLPISGKANKWTDVLYFSTEIDISCHTHKTGDFKIGEVAYWPENKAICIFYGLTSASHNERASDSKPFIKLGHTLAKPELLKKVVIGDEIEIK